MFRSEDKIIEFVLELDVQDWSKDVYYKTDQYSFYKGLFYKAVTDNMRGIAPGGSDWTLGDNLGKTPPLFDVTTAQGILLYLYDSPDNIIQKYSLVTKLDHSPIYTDVLRPGLIYIEIPSSVSILPKEIILSAEIKIRTSASNFSTGTMDTIIHKVEVNLTTDSILRNMDVPVTPCSTAFILVSSTNTSGGGRSDGTITVKVTCPTVGHTYLVTDGNTFQDTAGTPSNIFTFTAEAAGSYTIDCTDETTGLPVGSVNVTLT